VSRIPLEVADIFRAQGPAWRHAHAGHISLDQLKVMSAIEHCRCASLGGHVLRCPSCEQEQIAYNSCRNRHCPKCQATAAKRWLEDRKAELLPVEYYHLIFTLPAQISSIAYQNKSVIYRLLFKVAAETLLTIAADPERLGARLGVTMVLHTWGSALTHHPHVHCIVPGGGFSRNGQRWITCRPRFFLPVLVLSALFQRRFLEELTAAHERGELHFFGHHSDLTDLSTFKFWMKPLKKIKWYVDARRPFAGPSTVLEYLARYTHRVAISNSRLIKFDDQGVTFKYKDYRVRGKDRQKEMTLPTDEFIRRFLLHVLPSGFHRIRHYGFFANAQRRNKLAEARKLLNVVPENDQPDDTETDHEVVSSTFICRICSAPMIIIEVLAPDHPPRAPPRLRLVS
jgi:hypothetical protein